MTTIPGTEHENLFTLVIVSRSVLVRMRNVSDKSCRENIYIYIYIKNLCSTTPPAPRNSAICEIMWKNTAKPDRPHITIWPFTFSC